MKRISGKFRNNLSLFLYLVFLSCLGMGSAKANLAPRLSANAFTSSYTVGQADLMLPALGSMGDNAHNLYLDPNVAYGSNSQWYTDLGLGYRWIQSDVAILGWYAFAGYTRLENNVRMFVANPGVEILGSRWDVHLNGYFPIGERNHLLSESEGFGTPFFSGHTQLESVFTSFLFQKVGNGGDIQFAYQFVPGSSLKAMAGSYFFSPQGTGNIWGGVGGLEYWLDQHAKVFVNYSYDNVRRSVGAVGIGIEFGGIRTTRSDPSLEERIMDPVGRYLAELGRGSAIPSRTLVINSPLNEQVTQGMQGIVVLRDDIAFFSQSGTPNNGGTGLTLASCTFENPCGPTDLSNVSAATLSALLPNTRMYFNGGSYNATATSGGAGPVLLAMGQSINSRTSDYSQPATGSGRSQFNGAFTLPGNNSLNSIILIPTPLTQSNGITTTGAGIQIANSQIGSAIVPFLTGVNFTNTTAASLVNTPVFAASNGILSTNSQLTVQSSIVNVTNNTYATTAAVEGIVLTDASNVVLNNSQVNVTNATSTLGAGGVELTNASNVVINNSQVNVNTGAVLSIGTGISVDGTSEAMINTSNVASNNTNSLATSYGLSSAGGIIQMNYGTLAVAGPGTNLLTNGSPSITLNAVACSINGNPALCP